MRLTSVFLAFLFLFVLFFVPACNEDDDDPSTGSGQAPDDDSTGDDDDDDDDAADDDSTGDDDDDDDDDAADDDDDNDDDNTPDPPEQNPNAKADAFRLFYRERVERSLLSMNRFGITSDVAFGTVNGKNFIAKTGNEFEVIPGPNDNNPIGYNTFSAWNMYKAIGGRPLELTLIRMFEGLRFNEEVSGHPGLTCREALPGWTRVVDGTEKSVTRTRFGVPVVPGVAYDPALESEIIDAFFNGYHFTYRENPEEYYFNFKPINELGEFAVTFVFDELDATPPYLRISNCCSSWMISQIGKWEGAFWGNHNSRDNFTDYALGYLAAFDAEAMADDLPGDLAEAARNAADTARRTGDAIASADMVQMTVGEHEGDYNILVPGGIVRPDGTTEWQDLGSLASCQMVYVAQAISSDGLSFPVPEIEMPGAIETTAIQYLFDLLGLPFTAPPLTCRSLDDAFIGMGWGDILNMEIFGIPWYELADLISRFFPDLLNELLGGTADDFKELVLGAVNLCYYARIVGDDELYAQAHQTLENLINMTRLLADLVYGSQKDAGRREFIVAARGPEAVTATKDSVDYLYYIAAMYARMFDIDAPLGDFGDWQEGISRLDRIEAQLYHGDSSPDPLMTDPQIQTTILNKLAGKEDWIQQRYANRFGAGFPVRVNATQDGYECIGADDNWKPAEIPRHWWFGDIHFAYESFLCNTDEKHTLDCSWAALGCAPADLDESGLVDTDDLIEFNNAWSQYGQGASCSAANDWCGGADLDQSGVLEADDQGYMNAAQGCTTETDL